MKPFDLVLSRVPDTLAIQQTPSLSPTPGPTEIKTHCANRLRKMLSTASQRLGDPQPRHKWDHDNRLRRPLPGYAIDDDTLVKRETALREKEKSDATRMRNKLAIRMEESFRVVAEGNNTITILRDGFKARVPKDGVVKASCKEKANRVSSAPKQDSSGKTTLKPAALRTLKKTKVGKK